MFLNERLETLKYLFLIPFIFLMGCSKSESVKFTESQNHYIGAWQFLYKSQTASSFDIKNMLLVINPDSSAIYKQCIISKTVSENSISKSSVNNVSMLNPNIVGLSNNEITLEQEAEFLFIGPIFLAYDLAVTKAPYLENGHWYMEINNTLLEKLEGSGTSTQTAWECPKIDDEDLNE